MGEKQVEGDGGGEKQGDGEQGKGGERQGEGGGRDWGKGWERQDEGGGETGRDTHIQTDKQNETQNPY